MMKSYYEQEMERIEKEYAVRSTKYDVLEKDVDKALETGDKEALKDAFSKMLAVYEGKSV